MSDRCHVCDRGVGGPNYAGDLEQHYHTFIVQGYESYFHPACLALYVTGRIATDRKLEKIEPTNRLRFVFPDASDHEPQRCGDNPEICWLCGCHVANHSQVKPS